MSKRKETPEEFRARLMSIGYSGVKPTVRHHAVSTDRAPVGEHISYSLPRWTSFHKGKFTKNGKPIIRSRSERDHITKASNGRYVFD